MEARTPSEEVAAEVASWSGVEVDRGEIGELGFKVGRREIGHVHGEVAAHFSFPKQVWHELQAAGRVTHHPVFPGKVGPAERRIASAEDVQDVIELFRVNYRRLAARRTDDRVA
jgi:hypothetical protein